jgi:hypothetical protein
MAIGWARPILPIVYKEVSHWIMYKQDRIWDPFFLIPSIWGERHLNQVKSKEKEEISVCILLSHIN